MTARGSVFTWTSTGERLYDRQEARRQGHCYAASRQVAEAAIEGLTWEVYANGLTLPLGPAAALQHLIRELELPRVTRVAWDGAVEVLDEDAQLVSFYGLFGVEANYQDGRALVYVIDRGADCLVMATEFFQCTAT